MALPTITLFNLTVGDIELTQLAVTVPGSGDVIVSDFNLTDEILNDEELQTELGAGNLRIDLSGGGLSSSDTTKTLEQSKSIIKPLHDLDIKHNLAGAVAPVATDDEDSGYSVGSLWVDDVADTYYFCADATAAAAVWVANGGTSTFKSGTPGLPYNDLQFYIDPNNPTSFDGSSTATAISDLRDNFTSAGTVTSVTIDDGNWNYGVAASRIDMGVLPAAVEDIYDGGGAGDAWIRAEGDGGANEGRIMDTTESLTLGWYWYVTGESGGLVKLGFFYYFTINPGTWTTTDAVISLDQLTHVTVSYNADDPANNPTFWIDEVEYVVGDGITEDSIPDGVRVSDSGNSLFVGNRSNLDRAFLGDIGPVRLWSRTLSVEESQSILSIEGDRYDPGVYGINSYEAGRNGQSVIVHAGDMLENTFSNTAGDLLVRAGDSTNTGSTTPNASLTIRSGDGRSPTNNGGAGAPYAVTIRAGENNVNSTVVGTSGKNSVLIKGGDIPATVTQGNNNVHGGDVTVQGGDVISSGGNNMRGGNVFILGGQNGGGASADEGNVTLRSGPPHTAATTRASGAVIISTGYDAAPPSTQNGTGPISINTSENIGTSGFRSGNIEIRTGDTNLLANNTSGKIDIIAGTEAQRRGGSGSPDVTIQAGGVSSSGSLRPAGSISLTAGDQTNTTFDNDSPGGSITMTAGNSVKFSSSSGGGAVSLTAGDHTLNNSAARGGNMFLTGGDVTSTFAGAIAGSVTITSGSCTGNTGTPGAISLIPGTDTGAGIGDIILSYATWPSADGAATQALTTDGAGNLSWGTGAGGVTRQVAYENGAPIIVSAAEGVLTITGTPDDATTLMSFTSGAHTGPAGGRLLELTTDNNSIGEALHINNVGSGSSITVQDNGTDNFDITGAGAVLITPTTDGTFSCAAGNLLLSAFLSVNITALGANAPGDITITGSTAAGLGNDGGSIVAVAGGGNVAGTGGQAAISAGAGGATGDGGLAKLTGGQGGATSGTGGGVSITGGQVTEGIGGAVTISAGDAAGTAHLGGTVIITAGDGVTTSDGGQFAAAAGAGGATGGGGVAKLAGGAGGATSGDGGAVSIDGGTPIEGDGGAVIISGKPGVGTNRAGGVVTIDAGNSTNNINGADVSITAGDGSAASTGGNVNIDGGLGRIGGDINITSGAPIGLLQAGDINITAEKSGGAPGKIVLTTESDDVITAPVEINTQSGFVDQGAEHRTFASSDAITNGVTNQVVQDLGTIGTNGHNLKVVLDVTATDSITDSNFVAYRFVGSFYQAAGTVFAVTAFEDQNYLAGTGNWTSNISFHVAISGLGVRLELDNNGGTGSDNFNLAISTMSVVQLGGRTA